MKGLPKNPIPEKRTFTRFFGIPDMEVEIFRLGHPKAQRPEDRDQEQRDVETTSEEMKKARARLLQIRKERDDRPEEEIAAELELVTRPEMVELDETFAAFMLELNQKRRERAERELEDVAIRYVAAWRGKAFSPRKKKRAAFDDEDVRAAFFEPRDDLEAVTLPSFEREADGAPVYEQELVEIGAEIVGRREKRLDQIFDQVKEKHAAMARKRIEESDSAAPADLEATEDEKKARVAEWEKLRDAEIERAAEELRAAGLRECPFAGMTLDKAMAAQIIDYATEAEDKWRAQMGPLVGRFGSPGASVPFRLPRTLRRS